MQKAVFLDRDGVINEEYDYVHKIEQFHFIDGVFDALKTVQNTGFLLIVVTNQSGIGRGYYTEQDYEALTEHMLDEFSKNGVQIAAVYHCPHILADECLCRKPSPQMLLEAEERFKLEMQECWMVGDKESDILCAINAGVPNTILVKSGHEIDESSTKATHIAHSIVDASRWILSQNR